MINQKFWSYCERKTNHLLRLQVKFSLQKFCEYKLIITISFFSEISYESFPIGYQNPYDAFLLYNVFGYGD